MYLKKGIIGPEYLCEDGTIRAEHDPMRAYSEYFGVYSEKRSDELLISGRLIQIPEGGTIDNLQVRVDQLSQEWQDFLYSIDPETIVEMASLVRRPNAPKLSSFYLIREILNYSVNNDIKYWIFGLHPGLARTYQGRFKGAIKQIGEGVQIGHLKPLGVPYILDIDRAVVEFTKEIDGGPIHQLAQTAVRDFMRRGAPLKSEGIS
ncbi:hypothetical protein CYG49_01770 [Candidatus Saccharibacteria bacterium]|nr:MAG: hypothetical protein CYG49_01770 [Candidatus Saccharibacteria bacterium]